ncbi:MAG: redox-regulated ATPase YchF [Chloroflexi bacterium]|nr:redox-regulated ATPase YchF [Chloroflexota bacterium]
MQVAIIGLPTSGKTTVFNALTRAHADLNIHSPAGMEANVAVVKVPDARLSKLASIFKPKRIVPADITYVDIGGFAVGFGQTEGFSGQLLSNVQKADTLVQVVRAFVDPTIPHITLPHTEETVDPERDITTLDMELAFSDLGIIERRLERIRDSQHKVKPTERAAYELEAAVLAKLKSALEADTPIRALNLSDEEDKVIRPFQFLTAKPMLVLVNIHESQIPEAGDLEARLRQKHVRPRTEVAVVPGKVEMEIAQLDDEELAAEFRQSVGITESALGRVIRLCYHLLGYLSFFTGGPDEVRAWTIRKGASAQKAAGAIHSDMERGFIRAEVVHYDDLTRVGSLAEARKQGLLRLEGKNYVVKDGDLLTVLFNV